ncbi:MAG TPA: molybdopterin-dependent oxidoreductase [Pseudomonadales bacterium]
MSTSHTTFCRICEAQCGLLVSTDGPHITDIKPDTEHVTSRGYACIKGLTFDKVRNSPDRLQFPLKKTATGYQRISWEQALGEIGQKVRALRKAHGNDATAVYFGNPISFSPLMPLFVNGFVTGLNTNKFFNTGSIDCNNKFLVSERLYGAGMALTFPDVDRNQFLMILGGNPAVSKMSFIHLPHPVDRLKAITERGGRVVFVNPRLTESAKAVGEQVFIRPDTDVFFLFAFLHEVLRRDAVKHETVRAHMTGFDELASVVAEWTPEKAEAVTGITAARIRELVTAYLAADGAALYLSTGVNMGRNGTLAFWALEVINAITGNLDRLGGSLMGLGIIDYAKLMAQQDMPQFHSRIGNTPSLLSALPMGVLADEILQPGDDKIRALFVISGNPVLTSPNSDKLERALDSLELMVSIETFRNETAQHADYILPGSHWAERPDIPFMFVTFCGLSPTPWFQYTDRLVAMPGECRDELWTLSQLARVCQAPLFGSRMFQTLMNVGGWLKRLPLLGGALPPAGETLLALICRMGKQGSLKKLRRHPHGVLRAPLTSHNYLGKRVVTADGKIHLAPSDLIQLAADRLPAVYADTLQHRDQLRLITKRERFSHNSWAHNDEAYIKGKRHTNYLYMHPDDAARLALAEGERVCVRSQAGEIAVPLAITTDMMPGSVALPHGWGHQNAKGLSIASTTEGANVNILASDGPDHIEPLSGMAQLTGIPVTVTRAA